ADDLGWNSVGFHNDEFKTPHIDSIAAEGMELDRFYVAPMCSPTRAGFMTGRYPIRFGCARAVIPPQRDFGLPLVETTIGEMLGKVGYQHRGVFGKWHLGHRRSKWHPLNQGFTHFNGHYNGAIDYFQLTRANQRDWHVNYDTSDEDGYATDLIADAAADWIKAKATDSSPYFCYVPFNAPHSPFQAPDDAITKYGDAAKEGRARNREIYKAMVGRMDEGIGKILDAIDVTGESENTIVWFFSDNGGVRGLRDLNKPLRGSKLTVYEGGIRVPSCVRWPAKIHAGSRSETPCGYVDLLPTLVSAAGHNASEMTDRPLDGVDLTPMLVSGSNQEPPSLSNRAWYSYHGQSGEATEHLAVAQNGWKLKVNGPRLHSIRQLNDPATKNEVQLFHLANDPREQDDVSAQEPERVAEMAQLLVQYRATQAKRAVPRYGVGKDGFVAPKDWKLDPQHPNQLIGAYAKPIKGANGKGKKKRTRQTRIGQRP
ncbi:MAG: sulfatase-like hydrolase/transferase, partial [Planctomycetota bacterium]